MKKFRFLFVFLVAGMVLAFISMPSQSVSAKDCFNNGKPVPCPNYQNATQPVPPTKTPIPNPSDVPQANNPPDPAQLALMCTGAGFIPNTGNPNGGNSGNPNAEPPAPASNPPSFSPFLLGGGSLLVGILIGLLLPAVRSGFGKILPFISPRDNPAGIIAPTDNQGGELSGKQGEAGFDIFTRKGDAGFDIFTRQGDASNFGGGGGPGHSGNASIQDNIIRPSGGPHTAEPPGSPDNQGFNNVNGDLHSPRDP